MPITVRLTTENDMPEALRLIQELADFEKEPKAVEISVEDLIRDGFKEHPEFQCFIAEDEENIVGLALVYYRYSTWKGKVLHLEDLIVKQEKRGMGIGTRLLDEVVRFAAKKKVKRLSWEVLDWNSLAIDFYEKKGANVMKDWHVVQLDEMGIKNYIESI